MASGKKTTWVFGDDGSAEVVRPKLKAWWIKKPPTAAARSKKRWVEVYLDEIKYFSKTDGNHGLMEKQKGCIGLFSETKVSSAGNVLTIVNPDRTWVLEVAKTKDGKAADPAKWAAKISKLAGVSTNKGYLQGGKGQTTSHNVASSSSSSGGGGDDEHWEVKQKRLAAEAAGGSAGAKAAAPAATEAAAAGGDGDGDDGFGDAGGGSEEEGGGGEKGAASEPKKGGISRSRNKHQQSFYGFETISDDDEEEEEEEFGFE